MPVSEKHVLSAVRPVGGY